MDYYSSIFIYSASKNASLVIEIFWIDFKAQKYDYFKYN